MPRAPGLIALGVVAVGGITAVGLAADPGRFNGAAAAMIALGLAVLGIVAVTGLLIARSTWSRMLAGILVALEAILGATHDDGRWSAVIVVVAAATLAGISGPWLRSWVRRPHPDAPRPHVVVLVLGLLAVPILAGLAAPSDAGPGQWALAVTGLTTGWMLTRAYPAALWAGRLAVPVAGLWSLATSPAPGAVAIAASYAVLTALAWSQDVSLAVRPVAPLRGKVFPIPPELAPPEILDAAGLDEHGRRTQPG